MSNAHKTILIIAIGVSLILLAAGTAYHIAVPAPLFNFPLVPKK